MSDDRHTLRCENCGYDLLGAPADGACAECGKPVRDSHPDNRPGSPWQQRMTPLTWLNAAASVVVHPRRTFDRVRIESRASIRLIAVNITITTLIATVNLIIGGPLSGHARTEYAAIFFVAGWLALAFLTAVEVFGLRFFGRRRGWRTDLTISLAVCAHASYGWLLSGLGVAFVWQWQQWCRVLDDWARQFSTLVLPSQGLLAAAFFTGLIAFELLAYVGFIRCRYANRANPTPAPDEQC